MECCCDSMHTLCMISMLNVTFDASLEQHIHELFDVHARL